MGAEVNIKDITVRLLGYAGWWDWWEPRWGVVHYAASMRLQRRLADFCWWMGTRPYGRGAEGVGRWVNAARALREPE